jgi:voltage-gated sodium channel
MKKSLTLNSQAFWVRFFTDDRYVGVVIAFNALILFLLSFRELEGNLILGAIDAVFLFYFLIEAILKIRILGWKGYMSSAWNRFEFLIVLASIPSLLLLFKANFSDIAFIFVFRIVRMLRFLKFIRFIPNLGELVAGVRRAFKASVFVLLAFFVYSFIISLISCRLYQHIAPELFGDPIRSFYQTFKVFTIEGWYEVPEQIIAQADLGESSSFATKFYFILIVISGGLFGLSIVNAIFVEEMVRDNNDELYLKVEDIQRKLDTLLERHNTDPSSPDH